MSRKKKIQQGEGGGEEWLQTYADTITLLRSEEHTSELQSQ